MPPSCWRNATWPPWGASGLPEVNPLPLAATPAPPVNVHAAADGVYWKLPDGRAGAANPGSATTAACRVIVTPSMNVVLSPPFRLVPWNVTVWWPAVAAKADVL